MKFGFDLDGTLDRPELAELANHLLNTGQEVHVITVVALGECGYITTRAKKAEKLNRLGVRWTKLHLVRGRTYHECGGKKAEIIRREGIVMMFDDSTTFCSVMAKETEAVILYVKEPSDQTPS